MSDIATKTGNGLVYLINGSSDSYGWNTTEDGKGIVIWNDSGFQILEANVQLQFTDMTVDTSGLFDGSTPAPTNDSITVIRGTADADDLAGTTGDDDVFGLGGDDVFRQSSGNDWFYGGAGNDRVQYLGTPDQFTVSRNADGNIDVVKPDGSVDTLFDVETIRFSSDTGVADLDTAGISVVDTPPVPGPDGVTVINGTTGNDDLIGTAGDDDIFGLDGDDVFRQSDGSDWFYGGAGNDRVQYLGTPDQFTVSRNADGNIDVVKPDGSIDTLFDVETIRFVSETGVADLDTAGIGVIDTPPVPGPDGVTVINGTTGNDDLIGTAGDDKISGLDGDDVFRQSEGSDSFYGGAGSDRVQYLGTPDQFMMSRNADGNIDVVKPDGSIDTLFDVETIRFSSETGVADLDTAGIGVIDTPPVPGPDGVTEIMGTADADDLTGTAGDDQIFGLGGDDVFSQSDGSDLFFGGAGNDRVQYLGTLDQFVLFRDIGGNIGVMKPDGSIDTLFDVETISFSSEPGVAEVLYTAWIDPVDAPPDDVTVINGTTGNDDFTGTAGDDEIFGLEGDDTLKGTAGNDLYFGGEGQDTVTYAGNLSDFSFRQNDDGTVAVYKADGSFDILNNVENLVFSGSGDAIAVEDVVGGPDKPNVISIEAPMNWKAITSPSNSQIDYVSVSTVIEIPKSKVGDEIELAPVVGHPIILEDADLTDLLDKIDGSFDVSGGRDGISVFHMDDDEDVYTLLISFEHEATVMSASELIQRVPTDFEIGYKTIVGDDTSYLNFEGPVGTEWKKNAPVALDLNGDLEIGVTDELVRTVEFDLDADGTLETIEWFDGSGDGILVDTTLIGADGSLDGSALFAGEGGKYANGYEKLDLRDADGDDMLSGAELDGLGLWIDDGDAVLEDGEMKTVEDAGIASIATDIYLLQEDSDERLFSAVITGDGQGILSEAVWLEEAGDADTAGETENMEAVMAQQVPMDDWVA